MNEYQRFAERVNQIVSELRAMEPEILALKEGRDIVRCMNLDSVLNSLGDGMASLDSVAESLAYYGKLDDA